MSDEQLVSLGKAARFMCSPEANLGQPPREAFRDRPRLLAKQNGICPLCGATLTNDEATHIDHVVSVDAFADRIMSGELTFDDAYCQLWADENLRAVCRSCNMARNKRSKAARTPTREVSHDGAVQR